MEPWKISTQTVFIPMEIFISRVSLYCRGFIGDFLLNISQINLSRLFSPLFSWNTRVQKEPVKISWITQPGFGEFFPERSFRPSLYMRILLSQTVIRIIKDAFFLLVNMFLCLRSYAEIFHWRRHRWTVNCTLFRTSVGMIERSVTKSFSFMDTKHRIPAPPELKIRAMDKVFQRLCKTECM